MQVAQRHITPQIAAALLQYNFHGNRKLRPLKIQEYTDAMKRGEWMLTHQGIAFGPNGALLDGQHRLLAIIRSGVAQDMLVAENAPAEIFAVTDRGAVRSHADVLRLNARDVKVCRAILSILRPSEKMPSPVQVQKIYDIFGQTSIELVEFAGTRMTRVVGTAIGQAIPVIRAMAGERDYVFNLYKGLVQQDLNNLPPIALALVRQSNLGMIDVHDAASTAARLWSVYDETKKNSAKLTVKDADFNLTAMRKSILGLVLLHGGKQLHTEFSEFSI